MTAPDYGAAMRSLVTLRSELANMTYQYPDGEHNPTERYGLMLANIEDGIRYHAEARAPDYMTRRAWMTPKGDPDYPQAMAILRHHGIDTDPSFQCPHDWAEVHARKAKACIICGAERADECFPRHTFHDDLVELMESAAERRQLTPELAAETFRRILKP